MYTHTYTPLLASLLSKVTTRSLLMDSVLPPSRHSYFPNGWTNFLPNYSACNACTSSLPHSINFHLLSKAFVFILFLVHRVWSLTTGPNKDWKVAQIYVRAKVFYSKTMDTYHHKKNGLIVSWWTFNTLRSHQQSSCEVSVGTDERLLVGTRCALVRLA